MSLRDTGIPDVHVFEFDRFEDQRGWFMEVWNQRRYSRQGLDATFAQQNVSYSTRGVLRGLHFQSPDPQGKLVSVLTGSVFDVAVDLRVGSPTFGRWLGSELSSENRRQLWVPPGFAHGFLVLSRDAIVHYNCTVPYNPDGDRVVLWNDPEIGIEWPAEPTSISPKDRSAPALAQLQRHVLQTYPGDI